MSSAVDPRPAAAEGGAGGLPAGALFPSVPALVTVRDAHCVEVTDLRSTASFVAEGVVAQAIVQLLTSGTASSVLQLLGVESHAGAVLAALRDAPWLPLEPSTALRLNGFGTLFVELTGRCNERCVHCYAAAGQQSAVELPESVYRSVLDDARALGFRRVQLTGGEPLQCSFVVELVEHARALGIDQVEIFTNGLLLTDALLARLAPLRPSFAVSFYSFAAETHDAITATEGSHRLTSDALRRLCRAGMQVRAAMVVMEQNAGHEERTVAYLQGLGVQSVGISGSKAVGRGTHHTGAVVHPHSDARHHPDRPVAVGQGKLCVAHDGSVYPCIFNRADRLGHLGECSLRQIALAPSVRLQEQDVAQRCRTQLQCRACQLTARALHACAQASDRSVHGSEHAT